MKKSMSVLATALFAVVVCGGQVFPGGVGGIEGTNVLSASIKPKDSLPSYVPLGNWNATGVVAEMFVFLAPQAECDNNFVVAKAEQWMRTRQGAVDGMKQPRDFAFVSSLSWADFVDTRSWGTPFFRDKDLTNIIIGCRQGGTRAVAGLAIRQSPKDFSLNTLEGGAVSSEDTGYQKFVKFNWGGLSSYSDYIRGVKADGTVLRNGEDPSNKIRQLNYAGFWITNPVYSQGSLDFQRDYFTVNASGCLYIAFWFRLWATDGTLLLEARIDLPVNPSEDRELPSFPSHFSGAPGLANRVVLETAHWKNQVWFLEGATNLRGPWSLYYGPNDPPKLSGTIQIPATGKQGFFRLRQ